MTIAPTRESPHEAAPDLEVLIREARRRGRHHRLMSLVLAAGVVVAIAAVSWPSGSGVPHKKPVHQGPAPPPPVLVTNAPRCTSSELVVGFEGALAGAGSWNELFGVRNASGHACSIAGFPSVRFLSSAGTPVPVPTNYAKGGCTRIALHHGRTDLNCGVGGLKYHGAFPRAILAARSGAASFFIEGTDISTQGPGQAHPTTCRIAQTVRVSLPGSPVWHQLIGGRTFGVIEGCGAVAVLPLVPGRSGYYPGVQMWTILGVRQH